MSFKDKIMSSYKNKNEELSEKQKKLMNFEIN